MDNPSVWLKSYKNISNTSGLVQNIPQPHHDLIMSISIRATITKIRFSSLQEHFHEQLSVVVMVFGRKPEFVLARKFVGVFRVKGSYFVTSEEPEPSEVQAPADWTCRDLRDSTRD